MKWQRTEAAGRILKCIGILTAKIQPSGEKLIGRHFIVQMKMTQNILQKQLRSLG